MVWLSKGQYYAVKNALTKKEKDLINFYEQEWFLRTRIPTVEEVAKELKLSQVTINYYLQRRPVIKALEQRGINFRQHTQEELTATQVAAAIVVCNPVDDRSMFDKLDQLGINVNQYNAWLRDPQFKNLVANLADQNLANIRPAAITELTKKINQGDWQAIRYYLDATGEFVNNDAPQSEQLIKMMIEVIQRHVKNPVIMAAIAQDFKAVSQNRTLEVIDSTAEEVPQLTQEPAVNDPELEKARRMLEV